MTFIMMRKAVFMFFIMTSIIMQGGGFRVSLQGARQAAMAHTSAHTRDASVAFFNPAGISFIPSKLSIAAGTFIIMGKADFQNKPTLYKTKTDNPVSTPSLFNIAYKATDKLSIAFSFTTPFGSSVDWGQNWEGKDLITKITIRSYFFQPTVAYRLNDWFSVGAGYIYALGSVNLQKAISSIDGRMKLVDKNATGNGYNVGMYIRPIKNLDVSIAYRSNIDIHAVNGKARFYLPKSLVGSESFPTENDRFNAKLPLTSEITLGLTYRLLPQWTISTDLNISGWNKYKALTIDFNQNKVGNDPNDLTISTSPKNLHNTHTFRVGSEYSVSDKLDVRLGYYYDPSPISKDYWSPEMPSTDNNAITGGIGYKFLKDKLMLDMTGMYYAGNSRKVVNKFYNFKGDVKMHSFMFGLGLAWNPF